MYGASKCLGRGSSDFGPIGGNSGSGPQSGNCGSSSDSALASSTIRVAVKSASLVGGGLVVIGGQTCLLATKSQGALDQARLSLMVHLWGQTKNELGTIRTNTRDHLWGCTRPTPGLSTACMLAKNALTRMPAVDNQGLGASSTHAIRNLHDPLTS